MVGNKIYDVLLFTKLIDHNVFVKYCLFDEANLSYVSDMTDDRRVCTSNNMNDMLIFDTYEEAKSWTFCGRRLTIVSISGHVQFLGTIY